VYNKLNQLQYQLHESIGSQFRDRLDGLFRYKLRVQTRDDLWNHIRGHLDVQLSEDDAKH